MTLRGLGASSKCCCAGIFADYLNVNEVRNHWELKYRLNLRYKCIVLKEIEFRSN
jgi:hypothetical protein